MIASSKSDRNKQYRMQIILGAIILMCWLSPKAQTYLPGVVNSIGFSQWAPLPDFYQADKNIPSNPKWFFSKYAAISAGFAFYPGASATFISTPIGLNINRQITNNFYGFAGVYAAPTFVSFNHNNFMNPANGQSYPGNLSNPYSFGINPGIQAGLMYVNDARTFSISGSINVQRTSYPVYPVAPNRAKR